MPLIYSTELHLYFLSHFTLYNYWLEKRTKAQLPQPLFGRTWRAPIFFWTANGATKVGCHLFRNHYTYKIAIFYIENFDQKSCFVRFFHEWKIHNLTFLVKILSLEIYIFFKWDWKVTKIWHLISHRIWKLWKRYI